MEQKGQYLKGSKSSLIRLQKITIYYFGISIIIDGNMFHQQKQKSTQHPTNGHMFYHEFEQCYSPLLLPKMAKYLFRVKITSLMTSFIAKIKMYDMMAIHKQNKLIKFIKIKNLTSTIKPHQMQNQYIENEIIDAQSSSFKKLITEQNQKINKNTLFTQKHKENPLQLYQQLYEYIKIMKHRCGDLQEFIQILKSSNVLSEKIKEIHRNMQNQIQKKSEQICQILNIQAKSNQNNPKAENQNKLYKLSMSKNTKLTTDKSKRQNDTQSQKYKDLFVITLSNDEKQNKFNFLKKKKTFNRPQQSQQNKSYLKRLKFSKFQKQEIDSNRSEFSYNLNEKAKPISKHTQQKFFQDLNVEEEEKMFADCLNPSLNSKRNQFVFKSQKQFLKNQNQKQKQLGTWHILENQKMKAIVPQQIEGQSYSQTNQQNRQKSEVSCPTTRAPFTQRGNNLSTERKSKQIPVQQILTLNNNKDSSVKIQKNNISSRTSLTSESSRFNGKGIYGIKSNRNSKAAEQIERIASKDMSRTKKIRFGGFRKNIVDISQESNGTPSLSQSKRLNESNEKAKQRRNGKKLANNLNQKFQRIIQDQKLQKLPQGNQQKQFMQNTLQEQSNAKKKYASKIKRIKQETQTSLSNSSEASEDYLRGAFRIQKPKQLKIDKQNMLVSYCDLLSLQKSLKPISNYNEQKMFARYSYDQINPSDIQNFQFKYQDGRLIFNHEFYILNVQENRQKGIEQLLQRQKYNQKQQKRLNFMNKFKKCLEKCSQPIQVGYDCQQADGIQFLSLDQ